MKTTHHAPRRVGILGGISSAMEAQAKILAATPAASNPEHLPMSGLERAAGARPRGRGPRPGPSPVAAMTAGARALEAAGCEAFAVACPNTAHSGRRNWRAAWGIPLLHIADAAVEAIARQPVPPLRVGILATRGTLAAAFYGKRLAQRGFQWIAPSEDEQARLVDPGDETREGRQHARAHALPSRAPRQRWRLRR